MNYNSVFKKMSAGVRQDLLILNRMDKNSQEWVDLFSKAKNRLECEYVKFKSDDHVERVTIDHIYHVYIDLLEKSGNSPVPIEIHAIHILYGEVLYCHDDEIEFKINHRFFSVNGECDEKYTGECDETAMVKLVGDNYDKHFIHVLKGKYIAIKIDKWTSTQKSSYGNAYCLGYYHEYTGSVITYIQPKNGKIEPCNVWHDISLDKNYTFATGYFQGYLLESRSFEFVCVDDSDNTSLTNLICSSLEYGNDLTKLTEFCSEIEINRLCKICLKQTYDKKFIPMSIVLSNPKYYRNHSKEDCI
jgi:hypothetical protein